MDITNFAIQGFKDPIIVNKYLYAFYSLGITCVYSFDDDEGIYFVENCNVKYIPTFDENYAQIVATKTIIDYEYYLKILFDCLFDRYPEDWFRQLDIGDTVTIAERVGESRDYPFSFTDEMRLFSGKNATIRSIEYFVINEGDFNHVRAKYNGDDRKYHLMFDDGCQAFEWHSSMFIPVNVSPIKEISMIDLSSLSKLF